MQLRNGTRSARKSENMNAGESAGTAIARAGQRPSGHNHGEAAHAQLGSRIRELVGNLMRDVLAALATASATDIAELLARSGDVSWKRAARARATQRYSPPRSVPASGDPNDDADTKPPVVPADPFDITSPGQLLASPDAILPRTLETPILDPPIQAASPAPVAPPAAEREAEPESSTALRDADADAASERRPKVVLRAGERLLSATGSGVVIRRERRTAPKE
jgi:hypothetical protein